MLHIPRTMLSRLGRLSTPIMPVSLISKRYAGHNKWSQIRKLKAANDLDRSKKISKVVNQIVSAIRAKKGETDPSHNTYLASALALAKQLQVPKHNVQDAIKRAKEHSKNAVDLDPVVFQGRLHGVSFMIEALTGNHNKTSQEMRHLFKEAGAQFTAVAYQFQETGRIVFCEPLGKRDLEKMTEDAIEFGVEDIGTSFQDDTATKLEVFTSHKSLHPIQLALTNAGYEIQSVDFGHFPTDFVDVTNDEHLHELADFIHSVEQQEEVVRVSSNLHSTL